MEKTVTCRQCLQLITVSATHDVNEPLTCPGCGMSISLPGAAPRRPSPPEKAAPVTPKQAKAPTPAPVKPPVSEEDDFLNLDTRDADLAEVVEESVEEWDEGGLSDESAEDDSFELQQLPTRPKKKKKSAASSGKPAKSAKAAKTKPSKSPTPVVPIMIASGAVVGLLVVGLGLWAAFGRGKDPVVPKGDVVAQQPGGGQAGDPAQAAIQSDFGGLKRSSKPVVLDKPIAGVVADPPKVPDAIEARRPGPFTLKFAPVQPAAAVTPEATAANDPAPMAPPPLWEVPADPALPAAAYEIAADLQLDLTGVGSDQGNFNDIYKNDGKPKVILPNLQHFGGWFGERGFIPPILAGQNGPYAMVAPVWEKSAFGWKLTPSKPTDRNRSKEPELVEVFPAEIPVIDLRTGKPAGNFTWRIPFWLRPVLSPDGQTLVGPWYEFPAPKMGQPPETDEMKAERRALYVYRRDSKQKPIRMQIDGELSSMRFADDQTLVVLKELPQRSLEIWNTTDGKRTATIPLPHPIKLTSKSDSSKDNLDLQAYPPTLDNLLAVSPGGKYAAVMSQAGVLLASVGDGKLLGSVVFDEPNADKKPLSQRAVGGFVVVPIFDGTADAALGLEFLPDGRTLAVTYNAMGGGICLTEIDVTTGLVQRRRNYSGVGRGPALLSSTEDTLLLSDYPPLRRGFSDTSFIDLDHPAEDPQFKPYCLLRFPATGPLLAVRQPGDRRPGVPMVPQLAAVSREAYLQEVAPMLALDELGYRKRPLAQAADRSALKPAGDTPPAAWKAPPVLAPKAEAPRTVRLGPTWPHDITPTKAVLMTSGANRPSAKGHYGVPILATPIDLSEPEAKAGEPFEIFDYAFRTNRDTTGFHLQVVHGLPTALTPDGRQVVIADPDRLGRLELWSIEGQRLAVFQTTPNPKSRIDWVAFNAANQLLTLEDGTITVWNISDKQLQAVTATGGGYRLPIEFLSDRKRMVVSRGRDLDLIDAETCAIEGRLSGDIAGEAVDIAIRPDAQRVAVLYESSPVWITAKIAHIAPAATSPGPQDSRVVLWDLTTGQGQLAPVETVHVFRLGWIGQEHLILDSIIYDLKLDRCVLSTDRPFTRDVLGQYWCHDNTDPKAATWHLPSLLYAPEPAEQAWFSPDRALLSPQGHPIRLDIDVGDTALGKKHGELALAALQRKGWQIGGGGYVMKLTVSVVDTSDEIEFGNGSRIKIPTVWYVWTILDDQGRELAKSHTRNSFDTRKSRYVTKPDYETRTRIGAAGYYNFRGKDPRTAIIEEILEGDRGFTEAPDFSLEQIRLPDRTATYPEKIQIKGL